TREAIHRTADGRLLLVLHGDEFDGMGAYRVVARVADVGYGLLVRINRWINRGRRLLGYGYCNLSASLTAMLQSAWRCVDASEPAAVHEAARRGVAGVVCGHIHQPALRAVGPIHYCNTGDWVGSCTALLEHFDGRLELVSSALAAVGPSVTMPAGAA